MGNIIMILEILGFFVCFISKALMIWYVSAVALDLSIHDGLKRVYWETIEDYPSEDCVKPKICKKFFCYENKNPIKGIPKEIYFSGIVKYIGFWVYSIIAFPVLLFSEDIAFIIGIVYLVVIHVLEEYWTSKAMRKSFRARFKMLNRYNFKYTWNDQKKPYPKRVGKCEIIREYRVLRKKFVTIRMLDTGEYIDRVLMSEKKRPGENPVYILYEICQVKYIV